jgi:hypothetical protein
MPTIPGTVSFSPVSLPASAKPGQTGLFQFRPPQNPPVTQSGFVSICTWFSRIFHDIESDYIF